MTKHSIHSNIEQLNLDRILFANYITNYLTSISGIFVVHNNIAFETIKYCGFLLITEFPKFRTDGPYNS